MPGKKDDDTRRIYREMPDLEFSRIRREELNETGQSIYDEELQRRRSPEWQAMVREREAEADREDEEVRQWRRSRRPTGVTVVAILVIATGTIGALATLAAMLVGVHELGTMRAALLMAPGFLYVLVGVGLLRRNSGARLAYVVLTTVLAAIGVMLGRNIGGVVIGAFLFYMVCLYLYGPRTRAYFSFGYWRESRRPVT